MQTKRTHWLTAAALVLGTALAGAMARGNATHDEPRRVIPGGSAGAVSFRGALDRTAVLQGRDGTARMELVISAAESAASDSNRKPTDLLIVLDRSGSMSGEKIEHARASVRELVSQLRPQDRFSLVSYASDASVDLALQPLADGNRDAIHHAVARVVPAGGTNMSSGLDLAFGVLEGNRNAERVPHVILISDGLANEGDASPQGLMERARRAARGEYMLSAIGVGVDFNEYLMTAMADAGTGNYYFVHHTEDLANVFAREFDAARGTVASGLAIHVRPAPGVRVTDAAGYPLESQGGEVVVRPGSLFAGQERRIWLTLAMPNDELGEHEVGEFSLRFSSGPDRHRLALADVPRIACVAAETDFYSKLDRDAWERSVAVDEYNAMQEKVAREVKAGNRKEALDILGSFRGRVGELNRHVASAPVAEKLEATTGLEQEVRDAFEGDDQARAAKQNLLSKSRSADALDGRRVGAKKEAK